MEGVQVEDVDKYSYMIMICIPVSQEPTDMCMLRHARLDKPKLSTSKHIVSIYITKYYLAATKT